MVRNIMGTTKQILSDWFDDGVKQNADFMIVVCDCFDYEDYPVYVSEKDFTSEHRKYDGVNMQQVMEVYDLRLSRESQMSERRAFHYPQGFSFGGAA